MTPPEAIKYLDNLRRGVLTVQGPQGPQAVCGADHDIWRDAINVLKCEHPDQPKAANETPAPTPAKPA